jgi:acylphosphatase
MVVPEARRGDDRIAMADSGLITERVVFRGRVQGVGFRATTHGLARGSAVAGYVKNLPDGTVELVAQGTPEEISGFLDAIAQRFSGFIRDTERTPVRTADAYDGFDIR